MFASLCFKCKRTHLKSALKCFFRIEGGLAAKTIALKTSKTKQLSVGNTYVYEIVIRFPTLKCFVLLVCYTRLLFTIANV